MASSEELPVVDFSAYSLDRSTPDSEKFQNLVDGVHDTLTSIGFLYLSNHGIPQVEIDNVFSQSRQFFELPKDTKVKYARAETASDVTGYIEPGILRPNPKRPGDYRECFNFSLGKPQKKTPNEDLPGFRNALLTFSDRCTTLADRVLEVIARGLKMEDPYFFVKAHQGSPNSETYLRCAYYPPVPENMELKPGQIRCGEHTDFCALTLLFQDNQGGLEVKTKNGEYIAAMPKEGTIIVNIGELLQRWTADKLLSNMHRVVVPESEARHSPRQSVVFFYSPPSSYVIRCIDGSDRYPPITCGEYLRQGFQKVHSY